MKKIDWNSYVFRSSQSYKLMTSVIELESDFNTRIKELESERDNLINKNGNKVKWTDSKKKELESLLDKKNTPLFKRLPKTMTSELRKIHRSEKFGRNFRFTNKFVQKGLAKEEEAITVYQQYIKKTKGKRILFLNNKERLTNEFVTGEADLTDTNDFKNCNEGFDIKCSWELDTFPYKEDELDKQYEIQNQCYMWLSGAKKWTTANVLVNVTEDLLHKEKMKWYYALGSPDEDSSVYDEYVKELRELEIRLIFDYDKFVKDNPYHDMQITREEWFDNGYDIPLEYRVIEKHSTYNEDIINDLKNRIVIAREYLNYLDSKVLQS